MPRQVALRWLFLGIAVCVLATLPAWSARYGLHLVLVLLLYVALAQMWNLLAGYAGLLSLGQQSFVGLGGFTVATATLSHGVPCWMGVLLGGAVSAVFALLISPAVFRMRGVSFAVGTWIVAEALAIVFSNWSYVGGGAGLFIKAAYGLSLESIYYAALAMALLSVLTVALLRSSSLGLALRAIRDDEEVAQACGVHAFRTKLACFVIAAFVTGVTAGIWYLAQIFIQPTRAFSIDWTVKLLFIVIIGGMGTLEGPIVGALLFVGLQEIFSEYTGATMAFLGATAIAVILVAPKGVVGTLQERWVKESTARSGRNKGFPGQK